MHRDEDIQEEAGKTGLLRTDSQDVSRRNSMSVQRLYRCARHCSSQEPSWDWTLPEGLSTE